MKQYKVTNCTVKPIKLNKEGKDVRPALDKVGHSVKFVDNDRRDHTLPQGRFTIVNGLNAGILGLQRGGFVRIEEIKNLAHALREHALGAETAKQQRPPRPERKAHAVEMGKDTHTQKGGAEHESAVNPNGDPNFIAKPSKKRNKRRGAAGGNEAESGSDAPAGES